VRSESAADEPPDARDRSLVGRAPDLARFDDFLAGIPDEGGSLVLLGEPGVGKTARLGAVAAAAAALRVLQTTGVQYRAQASHVAASPAPRCSPPC
jgi:hypothetical protein